MWAGLWRRSLPFWCPIPSSTRRSSSRRGRCGTASFVSSVNTHLTTFPSHGGELVHRQGDVGDEVDGVKVDMCIANRGSLCESRKSRTDRRRGLVVQTRNVAGCLHPRRPRTETSVCRVMYMVVVPVPDSHSKHYQAIASQSSEWEERKRRRGSNAAGARCGLYDAHTMCNL